MSILKAETAPEQEIGVETSGKTLLPFKVGVVVNNMPIWLEAQIPYSSNPEEIRHTCEVIRQVFKGAVRLLQMKLS
ncbi:MAG: hypothetical protein QXG97_01245 [Nitrososphaerota archaeon]